MKTQPLRTTGPRQEIGRFYESTRPTAGRTPFTTTRHHPPTARHARYPSLSDDHQPPLISPRVIALLALIVLVLAIAVGF